jgi:hypothetical protein
VDNFSIRTRRGDFAFLRGWVSSFRLQSGTSLRSPDRGPSSMSTDFGQDDLPKILARAFRRAWEQYCEADLGGKRCEEVGRPFLKALLVEFAKEGVTDEEQLVGASLRYLLSLTRKPAPSNRSMKDGEKTTDGRWPVHPCKRWAPLPGLPT